MEEKTEEEVVRLSFDDTHLARNLFGPREENIKHLKKYFDVKTSVRGNHVTLVGKKKEVENTSKVIHELAGSSRRALPSIRPI